MLISYSDPKINTQRKTEGGMKMKKNRLYLLFLLASMLLLGGCSQQSHLEYIGRDIAESLALEAHGLSGPDAVLTSSELKNHNGTDYYRICFTVDGLDYQCDIDALTGAVIQLQGPDVPDTSGTSDTARPEENTAETVSGTGTAGSASSESAGGSQTVSGGSSVPSPATSVSESEARETALAQVPGASSSDIYEWETDYDDGHLEYEGKIIYNGMEYEFSIDGYSGAIREWEAEIYG